MPVRAAVLQSPPSPARNLQEWVDFLRRQVEAAANGGTYLAVLPYNVLLASGTILLDDLRPEDYPAAANPSAAFLLHSRAPALRDLYLRSFSELAARARLWLVPGITPEVQDGSCYLAAYLFSPDGGIAGSQRQTHRSREQRAQGITAGTCLDVFETDCGRVGLVVGEDVRYPEVARIFALQGAEILAHPAMELGGGPEQYLADLWRDVQGNQVFGLEARAAGTGRSAIYAPVEMTPDGTGFLAISSETGGVLTADLDFEALARVRADYPILDLMRTDLYHSLSPRHEEAHVAAR